MASTPILSATAIESSVLKNGSNHLPLVQTTNIICDVDVCYTLFLCSHISCTCTASTPQYSLCNVTQFACSLSGPCIPLAYLCNGIGDCPNGQDEARCGENNISRSIV